MITADFGSEMDPVEGEMGPIEGGMDPTQGIDGVLVSVVAPGGDNSVSSRAFAATVKFPPTRDYISIDTAALRVFELGGGGQLAEIAATIENVGGGDYRIEFEDDGSLLKPNIVVAADFGGLTSLRGILRSGEVLISPETEIIVRFIENSLGGRLGNMANYELQHLISALQSVELSPLALTNTASDVVILLEELSDDFLNLQLPKIFADSADLASSTTRDSLAGTFNRFDFLFTLSDSAPIGESVDELVFENVDFFSINIDSELGARFVANGDGSAELVEENNLVTMPFSLYVEQNDERDFPFVHLELEPIIFEVEQTSLDQAYVALNDGTVEAPDELSITILEDAFEARDEPVSAYLATNRPSSRLIYNPAKTVGVVAGSEAGAVVLFDTDGEELSSVSDVLAAAPIILFPSNAFTTLLRQPLQPVTPAMFDGHYAQLNLVRFLGNGLTGDIVGSSLARFEFSQAVGLAKDVRTFSAERTPFSFTTRRRMGLDQGSTVTMAIDEISTQGELAASVHRVSEQPGSVEESSQVMKGFVTQNADFAVAFSYDSDSSGMPITGVFDGSNDYSSPIVDFSFFTRISPAILPEVGQQLQFSLHGIELDLHSSPVRSMRSTVHGNTLTLDNGIAGGQLIIDNLRHSESRQQDSQAFPTLSDRLPVSRSYSDVSYGEFGEFFVESELDDDVTERWAGYVAAAGESVLLIRQLIPTTNSDFSGSASIGIYVGFPVSQAQQ